MRAIVSPRSAAITSLARHYGRPRPTLSVEVVAQYLRAGRVTELRHRLALDLTDPLARDAVHLADLVKRLRLTIGEAEAHAHHAGLALRQRVEHVVQLLLQEREVHRVRRDDRLGVLDEVAELGVAVLAQRGVQGDRLAPVLLDLDDLLRRHVELFGQLLRRRLAAEILEHLTLHPGQLVDDFDHVDRDTDGARLVGHGTGDGLLDPPRRVRGELVALGVVELLDRTDEAQVALLDEVQKEHAAAGVALRERDDESEVGLEEVVLRTTPVDGDPLVVLDVRRLDRARVVEPLVGEQPGFDPLRELDLLLRVEERDLADLLEVVLDGIGRGARGHDLLLRLVGIVGVGEAEPLVLGDLLLEHGLLGRFEGGVVDVLEAPLLAADGQYDVVAVTHEGDRLLGASGEGFPDGGSLLVALDVGDLLEINRDVLGLWDVDVLERLVDVDVVLRDLVG